MSPAPVRTTVPRRVRADRAADGAAATRRGPRSARGPTGAGPRRRGRRVGRRGRPPPTRRSGARPPASRANVATKTTTTSADLAPVEDRSSIRPRVAAGSADRAGRTRRPRREPGQLRRRPPAARARTAASPRSPSSRSKCSPAYATKSTSSVLIPCWSTPHIASRKSDTIRISVSRASRAARRRVIRPSYAASSRRPRRQSARG